MLHEDLARVTYNVFRRLFKKTRKRRELPLQNPELFQKVGIYSSLNDDVDNIKYHFVQAGLESFEDWLIIEPKRSAAAGFYYTGEENKVKCSATPEPRGSDVCAFIEGDYSTPLYPEYGTNNARLRTFETWPKIMAQTKKTLTDAGFFYTGKSDKIRCHHCGGGLKGWGLEHDPWEQHAKWFSKCSYLLMVKGPDYVNKVTGQHISPSSKVESNPGPSSQSITESVEGNIEDLPNANMQNNKTIDNEMMCKIWIFIVVFLCYTSMFSLWMYSSFLCV
ncbi:baculoviral IAP repeat-containing protein 3-like [Lasioglossum baleicum]|uniref:baculoviral IAP repeat-containing protein 3-like n=1 Tax=Lasioglossum baleicum TaxID=434251 RepID=UPI003FCD251B